MLIALDANPVVNDHKRHGIGKTTHRLYAELARHPHVPEAFDLRCYLPASAAASFPGDLGLPVRYLAPNEDIAAAAGADGARVLHLMDYFYPLCDPSLIPPPGRRPYQLVVTVRDVIPLHFPQTKRRTLERMERSLFPLLLQADLVVAISQYTKDDLVRWLRVPEERIAVIYHGVDSEVFHDRYPAAEVARTTGRYGLERPYVLYVSSFNERKNHSLLVHAFHYLRRVHKDEHDLLLVGPGAPKSEVVRDIRNLRLEKRVRILHDVSAADLARLYRGAALFAFPSLYEGFGNPVLEAMACGVPVVALRRSSVPEITGPAALLVDEDDSEAFGQAMRRVLKDEDLARRMRDEGRARAATFTWRRAADQTLEAYRRVAVPAAN